VQETHGEECNRTKSYTPHAMLLATRTYRPYKSRDTIRDDDSANRRNPSPPELAARGKPISPQKPVCGKFLAPCNRDDHGMMHGRERDVWRASDSAICSSMSARASRWVEIRKIGSIHRTQRRSRGYAFESEFKRVCAVSRARRARAMNADVSRNLGDTRSRVRTRFRRIATR